MASTSGVTQSPTRTLVRLRGKVIQLARAPALNFFDLAQLITALHDADLSSFGDIPAQTGMSRRRLYYLLAVGRLIKDTGLIKACAEEIGWTKLQIVARHLDDEEQPAGDLLEPCLRLARETKAHSLAEALRRGRAPVRRRAVTFYLSNGAKAELGEALLAFGATRRGKGYSGKEKALIKLIGAAWPPDTR